MATSDKPFNKLTPAEAERLALLAEECGEVIHAIGKVLRHGYESTHPDGCQTNRITLAQELGDVAAAIDIIGPDINVGELHRQRFAKLKSVRKYLHHQTSVPDGNE